MEIDQQDARLVAELRRDTGLYDDVAPEIILKVTQGTTLRAIAELRLAVRDLGAAIKQAFLIDMKRLLR